MKIKRNSERNDKLTADRKKNVKSLPWEITSVISQESETVFSFSEINSDNLHDFIKLCSHQTQQKSR